MINLWLFSTKGVITKKRLAVASRLGFERLLICPTPDLKKIAKWCSELDLRVMPMLPDWGDIKKEHPELAFRNHYRMFSFDSEDPLVVPNSWPCFWAKEAIKYMPTYNIEIEDIEEDLDYQCSVHSAKRD